MADADKRKIFFACWESKKSFLFPTCGLINWLNCTITVTVQEISLQAQRSFWLAHIAWVSLSRRDTDIYLFRFKCTMIQRGKKKKKSWTELKWGKQLIADSWRFIKCYMSAPLQSDCPQDHRATMNWGPHWCQTELHSKEAQCGEDKRS